MVPLCEPRIFFPFLVAVPLFLIPALWLQRSYADTKIEGATNEVIDGIAQFEATLQDNGINPRVTKDQADAALDAEFTGSSPQRTLRT